MSAMLFLFIVPCVVVVLLLSAAETQGTTAFPTRSGFPTRAPVTPSAFPTRSTRAPESPSSFPTKRTRAPVSPSSFPTRRTRAPVTQTTFPSPAPPTSFPTRATPSPVVTFSPTLPQTDRPTLPTSSPTSSPVLPTLSPTEQTASPTSEEPPAFDGMQINVEFQGGTPSPAVQAAFDAAAARWAEVIENYPFVVRFGGACGINIPTDTRGGVLIVAQVEPIDGSGGVLGSAFPCLRISGTFLTVLGSMRFDSADVDNMIEAGTFTDVVLHEMGHVLGIGSYWRLTADTPRAEFQAEGVNPTLGGHNYLAPNGNREDATIGRDGQAIIEDEFGPGTRRAHWKEGVYDRELMTGFSERSGLMPLSRLTVGALEDLGHVVNYDAADPFLLSRPVALRGAKTERVGCLDTTHPTEEVEMGPPVKGKEQAFVAMRAKLDEMKR